MNANRLDPVEWYREARPQYESLAEILRGLLTELLKATKHDVLSVTCRAKDVDSFQEKLSRKVYQDPKTEVTDLCGARIVVYLESEIDQIEELVRSVFQVNDDKSIDKSKSLKSNQVGYRSLHLICSFTEDRCKLPEYTRFEHMVFEIQIRTALQHAWAQIEWGRNYKLGGELPGMLERRLLLAAGALEIIDREFAAIAGEVDKHVATARGAKGAEEPLSTPVLRAVVQRNADRLRPALLHPRPGNEAQADVIQELRDFGIENVRGLQELLSDDFVAWERGILKDGVFTEPGLLRDAMMFNDVKKYFASAYKGGWNGTSHVVIDALGGRFGDDLLQKIIQHHGLNVF